MHNPDYPFVGVSRPDGYAHEANDCVVLATATATGIPYAEVHRLLAAAGRKPGQPVPYNLAWENGRIGLFKAKAVIEDITLGRFLRTRGSKGRFLVRIKYRSKWVGHVFAVVDGKAYDSSPEPRGAYQRLAQIIEFVPVQ